MLRLIYAFIFTLATPTILARLWWRGRKEIAYRKNIGERFGRYAQAPLSGAIWIHAVSVGEVRAAAPLIVACEKQFPQRPILLTCMTPTGRAMATELFASRVTIAYLPYDLPFFIRQLLIHFQPRCLLIVETEIWFNLVSVCAEKNIPVLLVNARLSERSRASYAKLAPIRSLTRNALGAMNVVAAQSAADAERFISLGAANVIVVGNMKFDFVPDQHMAALGKSWRAALSVSTSTSESTSRPKKNIVLLASTREGEEAMLLDAYKKIFNVTDRKSTLLVIVPRHPQRFNEVFQLINARGLSVTKRSEAALAEDEPDAWLGDSMGEMSAYYAMCDVAIIGGSFMPLGGQNLIEAAALGKPSIVGEHVFNFIDAVNLGKDAGAVLQVANADEAMQSAIRLMNDQATYRNMSDAAYKFAQANGGATEKTLALIKTAMHET